MSSIRCCINHFRRWPSSPRIWTVFCLLLVFLCGTVTGVADFSRTVEVPASPWLFPFLFTNNYLTVCIYLVFVLFICDAPFLDEQQLLIMIRIGKARWAFGQIAYVFAGSFLFFIFIFGTTLLFLMGNLEWSNGWGKVYGTLAQTDAAAQFGTIGFSYRIILSYKPSEAMAWSMLLTWMTGSFLGMLMFLLNLWFPRGLGAIAVSGFVFLNFFIEMESAMPLNRISPITWTNLTRTGIPGSGLPSKAYVLTFLGVGIVILTVTVVLSVCRRDIRLLQDV